LRLIGENLAAVGYLPFGGVIKAGDWGRTRRLRIRWRGTHRDGICMRMCGTIRYATPTWTDGSVVLRLARMGEQPVEDCREHRSDA